MDIILYYCSFSLSIYFELFQLNLLIWTRKYEATRAISFPPVESFARITKTGLLTTQDSEPPAVADDASSLATDSFSRSSQQTHLCKIKSSRNLRKMHYDALFVVFNIKIQLNWWDGGYRNYTPCNRAHHIGHFHLRLQYFRQAQSDTKYKPGGRLRVS
jgi:hypothetical protein